MSAGDKSIFARKAAFSVAVLVAAIFLVPMCQAKGLEGICGTYIYKMEHSSEYDIYSGRELVTFNGISNNSPVRVMLHGDRKLFFIYPMPSGSYCVKGIDLIPEDHREGRIGRVASSRATSGVHMLGWNGVLHSRKRIYRDWRRNLVLDSKVKQWQVMFFMPVPLPNIERAATTLIRADDDYHDGALDAFIRGYDFDADLQNAAVPAPPAALPSAPADSLFDEGIITMPLGHVERMLDRGFDVNARRQGGTPFLVFVMEAYSKRAAAGYYQEPGHYPILWMLLRRGVDVNASDAQGSTALHLARCATQVKRLLDAGANAATFNDAGERPIDTWIMRDGDLETARQLADAIPSNVRLGNSPGLIHAAQSWNAEMMRLLLSRGAAINSTNARGWTPLHGIASKYGVQVDPASEYSKPVTLLLDAGAIIDAKAKDGTTPLLQAVDSENYTVAFMLLERGADPNAINSRGVTPRDMARYRKKPRMQEILKGGAKWR